LLILECSRVQMPIESPKPPASFLLPFSLHCPCFVFYLMCQKRTARLKENNEFANRWKWFSSTFPWKEIESQTTRTCYLTFQHRYLILFDLSFILK
jgi:hypothetical protein